MTANSRLIAVCASFILLGTPLIISGCGGGGTTATSASSTTTSGGDINTTSSSTSGSSGTTSSGSLSSSGSSIIVDSPYIQVSFQNKMVGADQQKLTAIFAKSDANISKVQYLWSADLGTFSAPKALETTYTAPDVTSEQNISLSLSVNDGVNPAYVERLNIDVVPKNAAIRPPRILSISLDGLTINSSTQVPLTAVVIDDRNISLSYIWTAAKGSIGNFQQLTTTYTAPKVTADFQDTITLTASNGVYSNSLSVLVNVKDAVAANATRPPVIQSINATPGLVVDEKGSVVLTAIVSNPDKANLTYLWSASEGSFSNTKSLDTTYIAPSAPDGNKTVTLRLTVSDGKNIVSSDYPLIVVSKAVAAAVIPPLVINALSLPDFINSGGTITTSALVSGGKSGASIGYQWTATQGKFTSFKSPEVNYTAPSVTTDNNVTLTLTVTDGVSAVSQSKNIIVIAPDSTKPPVIYSILSTPLNIEPNATVSLLAYVGNPAGRALSYLWSASKGTLSETNSTSPRYTAPLTEGNVTIALTVSDGVNPPVTKSASFVVSKVRSFIGRTLRKRSW